MREEGGGGREGGGSGAGGGTPLQVGALSLHYGVNLTPLVYISSCSTLGSE